MCLSWRAAVAAAATTDRESLIHIPAFKRASLCDHPPLFLSYIFALSQKPIPLSFSLILKDQFIHLLYIYIYIFNYFYSLKLSVINHCFALKSSFP